MIISFLLDENFGFAANKGQNITAVINSSVTIDCLGADYKSPIKWFRIKDKQETVLKVTLIEYICII